MTRPLCLATLLLSLTACESFTPGAAEAVLDASEAPGRAHAAALTATPPDLDEIRATGLALLTVIARCWGEGAC